MPAYLLTQDEKPSAAISYDSRHQSDVFARETARVLAANGIKVYLYPHLMPTPALSFAVLDRHCTGGVMVTASHNPARYNGLQGLCRRRRADLRPCSGRCFRGD